MLLKGRRVFVTGASRGIGRAVALQAAREGADVVVHYYASQKQAKEVLADIERKGARAVTVHGDWGSPPDVRRVCEEAWKAFGGLDILVNNAGISIKKHALDVSVEEFDSLFATNVRGAFLASQSVARNMVEAGIEGQIFTITSVQALQAGAGLSVYAGTKAALELIMKGLALELSLHGIRVNTLALGPAETDMNRGVIEDPALLDHVLGGIPLRRMATAQEIAELVCALVSERARFMTGSTVLADGGLLLLKGYGAPTPYVSRSAGSVTKGINGSSKP
jgi:NAD(P)-dependent dehydrogenase (short-subunit alcohol dehydrogenase family)